MAAREANRSPDPENVETETEIIARDGGFPRERDPLELHGWNRRQRTGCGRQVNAGGQESNERTRA
jgi:hypothetical protein